MAWGSSSAGTPGRTPGAPGPQTSSMTRPPLSMGSFRRRRSTQAPTPRPTATTCGSRRRSDFSSADADDAPWSAPGEEQRGISEQRGNVREELRTQLAVDDAVVERQRELSDLPHGERAVVHPWHVPDGAEAQDRGFPRVEDGGAVVHAEHTDVGDGDGAALHVAGRGAALASSGDELVQRSCQPRERQRIRTPDVRDDQTAG